MPNGESENRKQGNARGGRAPLHSAAAVRLMRSQPPADKVSNTRDLLRLDRGTRIRATVAAVLVLALLAVVVSQGLSAGVIGPRATTAPTAPDTQALTTRGFLEMSVRADGWNGQDSTPVIVHLRRELPEGGGPERYHAIKANARESVELDAGVYLVSFISPIGTDGSIYRTPEEQAVEVTAGHTLSISEVLESVSPDDASRDDYLAIIDATRVAVEAGDDTLAGDAGASLLERLQANAEAGPNYAGAVEPIWDYSYQDSYFWWSSPANSYIVPAPEEAVEEESAEGQDDGSPVDQGDDDAASADDSTQGNGGKREDATPSSSSSGATKPPASSSSSASG